MEQLERNSELAYSADSDNSDNASSGPFHASPKVREMIEKQCREWCRAYRPFRRIPEDFVPVAGIDKEVPILYYGVPFTEDQAIDFARRHGIPNPEQRYTLASIVVSRLRRMCKYYDLNLEVPLSEGDYYLVSMYDNMSLAEEGDDPLTEEDHLRIRRIIKEELKVRDRFKWWWGSENKADDFPPSSNFPDCT